MPCIEEGRHISNGIVWTTCDHFTQCARFEFVYSHQFMSKVSCPRCKQGVCVSDDNEDKL